MADQRLANNATVHHVPFLKKNQYKSKKKTVDLKDGIGEEEEEKIMDKSLVLQLFF